MFDPPRRANGGDPRHILATTGGLHACSVWPLGAIH